MGRHSAPEPGSLDTGEQATARSWLAKPKQVLTGNGRIQDAPTTVLPALALPTDSDEVVILTTGPLAAMADAPTTVFPVVPSNPAPPFTTFASDPTGAPMSSRLATTVDAPTPAATPTPTATSTATDPSPSADADADAATVPAPEPTGAVAGRRHSIGRWVAVVLFWLIAMAAGLLSAIVSVARYGCSSGKGGLACGNNGTAIGVVLAVATIATVGVATVLAFEADRHARFWLRPLGLGLVVLIIIAILARIVLGTAG